MAVLEHPRNQSEAGRQQKSCQHYSGRLLSMLFILTPSDASHLILFSTEKAHPHRDSFLFVANVNSQRFVKWRQLRFLGV